MEVSGRLLAPVFYIYICIYIIIILSVYLVLNLLPQAGLLLERQEGHAIHPGVEVQPMLAQKGEARGVACDDALHLQC